MCRYVQILVIQLITDISNIFKYMYILLFSEKPWGELKNLVDQ